MKITITDVKEIINKANEAIEQYKKENPGVDVESLLSEQRSQPLECGEIARSELDKFISYAKKQGMKMPFDAMETGILAAGRKVLTPCFLNKFGKESSKGHAKKPMARA